MKTILEVLKKQGILAYLTLAVAALTLARTFL